MITIAIFSSKNIISKIIEFILGKPTSHSAIGFEKNNKKFFLHAAWGGVQITPREEVLSNHKLIAEFKIIPDMTDEIILAENKVGQPYDTIGLFGYIAVLIARKFKIGIKNPLASKSAVVCSEFIIDLDINKEIPEFIGLDPETITPRDLFDICSNGKSFIKLRV